MRPPTEGNASRHGDHFARRLQIQQKRAERQLEYAEAERERQFLEWAVKPENQRQFCRPPLSEEDNQREGQ